MQIKLNTLLKSSSDLRVRKHRACPFLWNDFFAKRPWESNLFLAQGHK